MYFFILNWIYKQNCLISYVLISQQTEKQKQQQQKTDQQSSKQAT